MKINYCDSWLSKAVGLMFALKPKVLVFRFKTEKIRPLHTFFVFYSIDIAFLDKNKKIVEMARVKPFSFYNPKNKSMYIVETPASYMKKLLKSIKL